MRALNLSSLLVLSLIIIAVSCQKRGDYEVPCKIEKIITKYQFHPEDPLEINIGVFSYNAWGDPVSIIQSVPTTGRPNYYFYYDSKKRLTAFSGKYSNNNIDSYSKYYYDNNNFIAFDTTYFAGSDINNPGSFLSIYVNKYSYDSKGRIAQIATKIVGTSIEYASSYSYDAKGNMVRPGYTYDNKTNFLRTSLILAFVNRDYSMNNITTALSYNKKGLPTSFSRDFRNDVIPSFFNTMVTEIEYSCDGHNY